MKGTEAEQKRKGTSQRLADILCLLVAVIWGTGFVCSQIAIDANMSPALIMAMRFVVGAVFMLVLSAKKLKNLTKGDIVHGGIAGVLLFVAFTAQLSGQERTSVSNTAFLTAINVVIVPFLVWIFTKKKPPAKIFLLAITTLIGIGVLSFGGSGMFSLNSGDALVLLCAVFYAMHIFYTGRAVEKRDAMLVNLVQMVVAAILSVAMLLIFDRGAVLRADFGAGFAAVLYLGVFSSGLSFFMQSYAQKYTSQSRAGILLSTEGLFGSLFAVLLGMEPLTLSLTIGGLIIFASLVLLEAPIGKKG